jgi:hypothetical protein
LEIALSGNDAYVANGTTNLWVFDVSDPANPREKGRIVTDTGVFGVTVSCGRAFLAERAGFDG